jgi:hypothetical protein
MHRHSRKPFVKLNAPGSVALAMLLASRVVIGASPYILPNGSPVIPAGPDSYVAVIAGQGTVAPPPGGWPKGGNFTQFPDWDCLNVGQADTGRTLTPIVQGWFNQPKAQGVMPINAPARPPDSAQVMNHPPVAVPGVTPQPLCGPLEWALHSFLWLTSPTGRDAAPQISERVFESPLFFDLQASGPKRFNLVRNQPGFLPRLEVRTKKPRTGLVSEAQTTGGVLMAQPRKGEKYGSLVFYEISVNDVYAYLVTAVAAKAPGVKRAFPTSEAELKPIADFATQHRQGFQRELGQTDEGVFALELKTAWVEADKVATGCKYINRQAVIPTYDTRDPKKWVVNGQKTTTLALVGMHIVGSGGGHPEMIWATFEHVCNTPDSPYTVKTNIKDTNQLQIQSVPRSTTGDWLFTANGSRGPFNVERMQQQALGSSTLTAIGKNTIGPSDTLRSFPWGDLGSEQFVLNNTQILLLNAGVALPSEDLRLWYVLIGAVWTTDGHTPNTAGTNTTGTVALSNSTMETYVQTENGKPKNCFLCHSIPDREPGTGMSHIFEHINPLPLGAGSGSTGPGTGTIAPSPSSASGGAAAAVGESTLAGTAASPGAAMATLVSSQPNSSGGIACTFEYDGHAFTRVTQKTACAQTASPPAKLLQGATAALAASNTTSGGGSLAQLVSSEPNGSGGIVCTFEYGGKTFKRTTHKSACPETSTPPVNLATASSGHSGAATPSMQPQTRPTRIAKGAEVTAISLRSVKLAKSESCPLHLTMVGEIRTNGATAVRYTWISSDGRSWPKSTENFTEAATQSVSTDWTVGKPRAMVKAWIQLSVVSPNPKLSKRIPITFACPQ